MEIVHITLSVIRCFFFSLAFGRVLIMISILKDIFALNIRFLTGIENRHIFIHISEPWMLQNSPAVDSAVFKCKHLFEQIDASFRGRLLILQHMALGNHTAYVFSGITSSCERKHAIYHYIQDDTSCPNVTLRTVVLIFENLGCPVCSCSYCTCFLLLLICSTAADHFAQTKISDLDCSAVVDQDVFQFDVSVKYVLWVYIPNTNYDLLEQYLGNTLLHLLSLPHIP